MTDRVVSPERVPIPLSHFNQYLFTFLSAETDNCPSRISGRDRMTAETIS